MHFIILSITIEIRIFEDIKKYVESDNQHALLMTKQ